MIEKIILSGLLSSILNLILIYIKQTFKIQNHNLLVSVITANMFTSFFSYMFFHEKFNFHSIYY